MSILAAIGGIAGSFLGKSSADKNIELQKQFAKNGIQWKVEDAKKAGIHPLAALGAQTHSFAPVSIGDPVSALGNAGQSLDRAIESTSSQTTRATSYDTQLRTLQLERGQLENEILRADLASKNALRLQAGRSPGIPTNTHDQALVGHPDLPSVPGIVTDNAMPRIAPNSSSPHAEPGAVTDTGYARTQHGWFPLYSKDAKERLEDDTIGELQWAFRNRILPFFSDHYMAPPPHVPLASAHYWQFNPATGEYTQRRMRKSLPAGRYHQNYYD